MSGGPPALSTQAYVPRYTTQAQVCLHSHTQIKEFFHPVVHS